MQPLLQLLDIIAVQAKALLYRGDLQNIEHLARRRAFDIELQYIL